jgi:hypothetical protein
MTDSNEKAAKDALTPSTFNFVDAILDRAYPEFKVPVYINEAAVQAMLETNKTRLELEDRIKSIANPGLEWAEKLEAAQKAYDEAVESLKSQKYTVTIRGIAPELVIELDEKTYEDIPAEYEESISPITGFVTKTEIPNDKRDEEFVVLIRQAHLVSVEAPDGSVDSDWTDKEKVRAMFMRLPVLARAQVDEAINNCTIKVDYYRELADEVF